MVATFGNNTQHSVPKTKLIGTFEMNIRSFQQTKNQELKYYFEIQRHEVPVNSQNEGIVLWVKRRSSALGFAKELDKNWHNWVIIIAPSM